VLPIILFLTFAVGVVGVASANFLWMSIENEVAEALNRKDDVGFWEGRRRASEAMKQHRELFPQSWKRRTAVLLFVVGAALMLVSGASQVHSLPRALTP